MKRGAADSLADLLGRIPELRAAGDSLLLAHDGIAEALRSGGTLFVCGNGGSAADAEHIVGELAKGFLLRRELLPSHVECIERVCTPEDAHFLCGTLQRGLRAVSLTSHVSLTTAIANDIGGELIFAQQLYALGRRGDALLAISTSGNARNVVLAAFVARAIGMSTVALTGRPGGRLAGVADVVIAVPAERTPVIQEYHLPVYHTLCAMLEATFFG